MPNCPQCLEEIKAGARKCPHCQTIFETAAETAGTAVYIIDNGLVRFAKFAVGVLAIFVLVGVYLFGFDIKQAGEKTSSAKHEVEKALLEIERQKISMDTKLQEFKEKVARVEALQREIEKSAAEIGQIVIDLRLRREEAGQIIVAIRALSPREAQVAVGKREERGIRADRGKLWMNGSTLQFRFLDGREQDKSIVRLAIDQWAEHVNLKFVETVAEEAELRISFTGDGSWSYVGNDALAIPKPFATLNYGLMPLTAYRNIAMQQALHEFGHALGLQHEFQNPVAGTLFDQVAVRAYKAKEGWSEDVIRQNLSLLNKEQFPGSRPYDRRSIMNYGFALPLFLPEKKPMIGTTLSDSDKNYVASLYPRQ